MPRQHDGAVGDGGGLPADESIPAASSAAATVALASSPNSSSGRASRVTSVRGSTVPLFAVIKSAS